MKYKSVNVIKIRMEKCAGWHPMHFPYEFLEKKSIFNVISPVSYIMTLNTAFLLISLFDLRRMGSRDMLVYMAYWQLTLSLSGIIVLLTLPCCCE